MASCPRMMFSLALIMLAINMIHAKYFLIETEDKAEEGIRKIGQYFQPADKEDLLNNGERNVDLTL